MKATNFSAAALLLASLVCTSCGKPDKDYTPPPPADTTDAPPAGGLEENPGEPRP